MQINAIRPLTVERLCARVVPAVVDNALDYDPNWSLSNPNAEEIPGSLRYAVSEARQAYLATNLPQVITFDPAVFGTLSPPPNGTMTNTIDLKYGTLGPETKYFPATDTTESYHGIDFPVTIRGPRITLGSSNELLIDESKARLNIHWSKSAFDSLQSLVGI